MEDQPAAASDLLYSRLRWLSSSNRFLFERSTCQASQQHLLPLACEVLWPVAARSLVEMPQRAQARAEPDDLEASFVHAGLKILHLQTFGAVCGHSLVTVV